MIICHCDLHFELPYVHSLKGRRSITNSIKERLKSFNVSVMDISGEYPKEADIALIFLSPDARAAAQYREAIEQMLERHFPELQYGMEYDEL
ncbi:DUF503 domain-containing protein [Sulfurimonas sp. HSL-3221]|uniref:DUF503 family protein n=1 Tax=Sulfurimonadaceae TaxID=2771471 RepID=UPI001E2AB6BD|nr:DUF503 domain-containing protein [Sulfurimonas sp. HSL-3221]UFS63631.1 DUF503 domain-containing protein [Sulfurimonas sp. HSL-3221]